MFTNNEIARYKKKSNKVIRKSKHKHEYKDCLFLDKSSGMYFKGYYCAICGKIGNFTIIETVRECGRMSRVLSQEELFDKYKSLKIKEVNNIVKDKAINLDVML